MSDLAAIWQHDSTGLIVARQPATRGLTEGASLCSVEIETGSATLLVPDNGYEQGPLSLSPAGDGIVFERVATGSPVAFPELWMYNLSTHELKRLTENGTRPRWMP